MTRKIIAVILALAMIFTLTLTAFAEGGSH